VSISIGISLVINTHNAFVSCVLVEVDICAKMAAGHAQIGT